MNKIPIIIIGLHNHHDSSVTILKNGKNIFSISEERFNRNKYYYGIPYLSLKYIFENAIIPIDSNITIACTRDIDMNDIVVKDSDTIESILTSLFNTYGFKNINVNLYPHHLAHSASAYYGSGIDNCLIITSDGEGDGLSGSACIGQNGKITILDMIPYKHSLGQMYMGITSMLGFHYLKHAGKITGLAAHGNGEKFIKHLHTLIKIKDGTIIRSIHTPSLELKCLHGLYYNNKYNWLKFIKWTWYRIVKKNIKKQGGNKFTLTEILFFDQKHSKENIAAGIQTITEDILCDYISYWVQKTGKNSVVLAGGVFANVKVNQRIMERCGVDEIFIYPYMGDGGLSFGCATLKYYQNNRYDPKISKTKTMYLGVEYSDEEILKYLKQNSNISFIKSSNIAIDTAKIISDRKIVGWFQGKMEFGPRALGSRSVVAMPNDPTINDWLNKRMQRTKFMPFAPSVLEEHMDNIFEIPSEKFKRPAEYMTITYNVKKEWQDRIAGVNHIDNTARPQMVRKKSNPLYHKMISEVYRLTGLPMTINTSFNIHEEPIVMSPNHAINSLQHGMVDVLAIGNYIVKIKD